jgi:hypothetical protein
MTNSKLNLVFKDERNYVHGTTIFDETIRLLNGTGFTRLESIEFVLQKMIDTNLQLSIDNQGTSAPEPEEVAIMRFVVDGQLMQARITPDTGAPGVRVPYDEIVVTSRCEIDPGARSIRLAQDDSGFSQIEVLVSMTKALHLAVLEIPKGSNWVFCRWDSPGWPMPDDLSGVMVTLRTTLGTRFTRADVKLNGQMLGEIYFSAKLAS